MSCTWLKKDGCKGFGGTAVGYWGREVYKRISSDNTINKNRALLEDQVQAGGIRAELWTMAETGPTCGCHKSTYSMSDRMCCTCHGFSIVPGFVKWGYENYWLSPFDENVTLVNVELTKDFKSSKCTLMTDSVEGYLESVDFPVNKIAFGSKWEYNSSELVRIDKYSSVTCEYSTDSGITWINIEDLENNDPTDGVIRFRVTLRRDILEVLSPYFSILRVRYGDIPLGEFRGEDPHRGPFIKVMTPVPTADFIKTESGNRSIVNNMTSWTLGLSSFDKRIESGSRDELLKGPYITLKFLDGTYKDELFNITSWSNSDPTGQIISTQTMNLRLVDEGDPYRLIW
jgi:hypothetical protein